MSTSNLTRYYKAATTVTLDDDGVPTFVLASLADNNGKTVSGLYYTAGIVGGRIIGPSSATCLISAVASDGVTLTGTDTWPSATVTDADDDDDTITIYIQANSGLTETAQSVSDAVARWNTEATAAAKGCRVLDTASVAKSLTKIDALGNIPTLVSMALTAPPSSPTAGNAYLVGDSSTGDWADKDGQIAYYSGGSYSYYTPFTGLVVYNAATGLYYRYTGSAWTADLAVLGVAQTWTANQTITGTAPSLYLNGTASCAVRFQHSDANKFVFGYGVDGISGVCLYNYTLLEDQVNFLDTGETHFNYGISVGDVNTVADTDTVLSAAGHIISGNTAAIVTGKGARIQSVTSGAETNAAPYNLVGYAAIMFSANSNTDVRGGEIDLARSGSNTRNTYTAVTSGVELGQISYCGADGVDMRTVGGRIVCTVNGAVSENIIPTQLDFYAAGSTGTLASRLTVYGSGTVVANGSLFRGASNGSLSIGASGYSINNMYIVNSPNVTSDANYKCNVTKISTQDALLLVGWDMYQALSTFQMNSAVLNKGADVARIHAGLIAQDVETIFANRGLDATRYGGYGIDETYYTTVTHTYTSDEGDKTRIFLTSEDQADAITADTDGATQTTDENGNTTTVLSVSGTDASGVAITITTTTIHVIRRNVRNEENFAYILAAFGAKIAGTFPDDTSTTTTSSTDSTTSSDSTSTSTSTVTASSAALNTEVKSAGEKPTRAAMQALADQLRAPKKPSKPARRKPR